jgi:hypothetical protein
VYAFGICTRSDVSGLNYFSSAILGVLNNDHVKSDWLAVFRSWPAVKKIKNQINTNPAYCEWTSGTPSSPAPNYYRHSPILNNQSNNWLESLRVRKAVRSSKSPIPEIADFSIAQRHLRKTYFQQLPDT